MKFKRGDRVRLTKHAIDKGYGYFEARGIVLDVSTPNRILVGKRGENIWVMWSNEDHWEIDPAGDDAVAFAGE